MIITTARYNKWVCINNKNKTPVNFIYKKKEKMVNISF